MTARPPRLMPLPLMLAITALIATGCGLIFYAPFAAQPTATRARYEREFHQLTEQFDELNLPQNQQVVQHTILSRTLSNSARQESTLRVLTFFILGLFLTQLGLALWLIRLHQHLHRQATFADTGGT